MGFNNLINFMDISDVLGFINNALRGLWAMLCEAIYPGIANLYQLFTNLGVLVYSDSFEAIYNKISLIIGIFMVFRVTFWLIEMLVNPDMITDKEKNPGKIVQKVLISVVLLAITPTIFKYAFRIQYEIVSNQIIEQIIIPDSNPADATESGRLIAAELFANFYTTNPNASSDNKCYEIAGPDGYGTEYENLKNSGTLNISNYCLTERENNKNNDSPFIINFNGIFATVVGIVVFWMILMYCISLGSRYAELIFLQVVAPVPIMCYLTPNKDNMLSKWVKQCMTTYLDLFIRIAIISFVIFLSKAILANENNIIFNISDSVQNGWMEVFLVLGLLMFAKKAPSLIQDLLPKGLTKASGDFGLSFKKRADNMLFGKGLSKGYDKTVGFLGNTAKGAALLPLTTGKKVITGIDSAKHGKGFWSGFNKNPGKARQWIAKQSEKLTPEAYKTHKEKIEGRENVNAINTKWNKGVNVAQKLVNAGVGDWTKAFDGKTEDNYKKVFKHKQFIDSKIAVDRASKNEETYRLTQQEISMANATGQKLGTRSLNIIGESKPRIYDLDTEKGRNDFSKDYETQQKILKGAEEVHGEISKQYQDDANVEKQYKYIKNNEVNPTNQSNTHETRGIKVPKEDEDKTQNGATSSNDISSPKRDDSSNNNITPNKDTSQNNEGTQNSGTSPDRDNSPNNGTTPGRDDSTNDDTNQL